MDAFKSLSAAATVADKKDQICGRAWITTQNLLSMQPGHYFNVCIKVVRMDTASHGLAAVVNLKLGNSIDDSPVSRQPQLTGEEIQMDCSARKQRMLPEQVYMIVGAKMVLDGEDIYMKLPPTTDSRPAFCCQRERMPLLEWLADSSRHILSYGWIIVACPLPTHF